MAEKIDVSAASQPLTMQQALDLAVKHHKAGDFSRAENIYNQILESDPDQPQALHLLGVIAHQAGHNEKAIDFISKAIAIKPDFAEAHSNLGLAYKALGYMEAAVERYSAAIEIKPRFAEAYNNLGNIFRELMQFGDAEKNYLKALTINSSYPEAHNNLGTVYRDLGKHNEAVTSYNEALKYRSNYAEAYYNLGITYKELGNVVESISNYQKAILIQENYLDAYNNLANVLLEEGRLTEAFINYRKALDLNLDSADAHNNLGVLYLAMGRLDEAIKSYREALGIDPQCMGAFSNLHLTLLSLCYEVLTKTREASSVEEIIEVLPSPPEPDILRLQLKTLTGGDISELWQNVVSKLPPVESESITNEDRSGLSTGILSHQGGERKMVALFHFGPSGSGYFHSLLDDHPQISTLPGLYMYGFFGRDVWSRISGSGFEEIPERFSSLYEVLFDARDPAEIPSGFISDTYADRSVGVKEGFTHMGPERDTPLTLDREKFIDNLRTILSGCTTINQGQFFEAVHAGYEQTRGVDFTKKSLIFYHLHKVDIYSLSNFLRYYPGAQLLTILRNPLQSCESWALKATLSKQQNKYIIYAEVVGRMNFMLVNLHNPAFSEQVSIGLRLEDLKTEPRETLGCLCEYLGIDQSPSLYQSTMQGLKWWGDPISSLYGKTQTEFDAANDPTTMEVGSVFSEHDQFILSTLFYPLSARFGYVDKDEVQFRNNLKQIRPYLERPLDFESKLSKDFPSDYPELLQTEAFKALHAVLLGVWYVLDSHGTYPHMMKVLPGT